MREPQASRTDPTPTHPALVAVLLTAIARAGARLAILAGAAALGCSCFVADSPRAGSARHDRWTLERTITIGDASDPEMGLTRVGDVVVHGERLFVVQGREQRVRIFSLAGDFLGFLGGPGEGPGEFRWMNGMGVRDGLVWVSDHHMGRVQHFDAEGRYASSTRIRGHPTLPMGSVHVRALLADGSMLVRIQLDVVALAAAPERPEHVIRFDARGSLRDTVAVAAPEERSDLSAPLHRVLEGAYRDMQFFPPVGDARAGADGTTWLLVRTGVDSFEWEVLDAFGRSVARVEPPPRGRMRWADTDALWFVEHDELDIPYLVRYVIRRP